MLEDVLSIPFNRPVFDDLKKLLAEQQAIAFVGAGASAGMYPLWGQFIDQLADYAVTQGKAQQKDAKRWKADTGSTPQQRVRTILRKLGDPHYHQFLKDTFGPRVGDDGKRWTDGPLHAKVARHLRRSGLGERRPVRRLGRRSCQLSGSGVHPACERVIPHL